ncbi:hypothetical protein [Kribbella antiqua]|nr:hypothetical protein [Kribbella antiqua]
MKDATVGPVQVGSLSACSVVRMAYIPSAAAPGSSLSQPSPT